MSNSKVAILLFAAWQVAMLPTVSSQTYSATANSTITTIISNTQIGTYGIIQPQSFWLALGTVGTLVSLLLIFGQIRASKQISANDLLFRLEQIFYSDWMLQNRADLSKVILRNRKDYKAMEKTAFYVLAFFENIGMLVKEKIIPAKFVWSAYSFCVLRYWKATEDYVRFLRKKEDDATYYEDFEFLYEELLAMEKIRRNKTEVTITDAQIKEFANEELRIYSKGPRARSRL